MTVERLQRSHDVDVFDCGQEALNRFLGRHALQNQQADASQTYVAVSNGAVVGYYTLVVGEIAYEAAADRLKKGLARHPVPVMVLARLAVSISLQGQGIGSGLLKDAMLRTMQAAEIAGIRAFIVHAKDDAARTFYEHFDLVGSPSDPYHLMILLKDLRKLLKT